MAEENEDEYDVTTEIANLASAFSVLLEVDGKMLSKAREAKLARMKRKIFDSMSYYCEFLPLKDDEGEE